MGSRKSPASGHTAFTARKVIRGAGSLGQRKADNQEITQHLGLTHTVLVSDVEVNSGSAQSPFRGQNLESHASKALPRDSHPKLPRGRTGTEPSVPSIPLLKGGPERPVAPHGHLRSLVLGGCPQLQAVAPEDMAPCV